MNRREASVVYGLDADGDIVVRDRSSEAPLMIVSFAPQWSRLSPAKKLTLAKTMLEIIEERETALGPTGVFGINR